MNKKKTKLLMKYFFRAAGITATVMLVGIGIFFIAYDKMVKVTPNKTVTKEGIEVKQDNDPIHKNIAVFGLDQEKTRTDIIFIVHINSEQDTINLVSVPRDTKVEWDEEQRALLEELNCLEGFGIDTVYSSKLNEMSHYGGVENIRLFTVDYLEKLFGIKIDNYVVVTIDAFKEIVDAIDGVEVNVPREMKYHDSVQGLSINLEEGLQTLGGEEAEGLMRWRHNEDYSEQYVEGDVGRVETQQLFYKAFADKILSPQIVTSIPSLVPLFFKEVKTDLASPLEILKYYNYIKDVKSSDMKFYIADGEAKHEEKWYYVINRETLEDFTNEVFFDQPRKTDTPETDKEQDEVPNQE